MGIPFGKFAREEPWVDETEAYITGLMPRTTVDRATPSSDPLDLGLGPKKIAEVRRRIRRVEDEGDCVVCRASCDANPAQATAVLLAILNGVSDTVSADLIVHLVRHHLCPSHRRQVDAAIGDLRRVREGT